MIPPGPLRVVVLVSGGGSNLAALIDASRSPDYGVTIVAVGADRDGIEGLARAERAGIPTFVRRVRDFETREGWDRAIRDVIGRFEPDLVLSAGFMKLFGEPMLSAYPGRILNTHPALCPAFPGMTAPADALAHGVTITGATLFVVDAGVDTGPILAQRAVPVLAGDDVASLHERIKTAEREMVVSVIGQIAREGFSVEGRTVVWGPPKTRSASE